MQENKPNYLIGWSLILVLGIPFVIGLDQICGWAVKFFMRHWGS